MTLAIATFDFESKSMMVGYIFIYVYKIDFEKSTVGQISPSVQVIFSCHKY